MHATQLLSFLVVNFVRWAPLSHAAIVSPYAHNLGTSIVIAGNEVPYGGSLCLVPEDFTPCTTNHANPDCFVCNGDTPCPYGQLDVKYREQNIGINPVPGYGLWQGPFPRNFASPEHVQYINAFVYDGSDLHLHNLYANLPPSSRLVGYDFTFLSGLPSNVTGLLRYGTSSVCVHATLGNYPKSYSL
jgi:hypothetical protein